ncbi:hypothetical protein P8452_27343 [Trifolium repens]|nr:adaptin ear-binding coat-associated protein [Trifolium repens]WJX39831.1 hypothetical protein P8452_27343 [Trifolium repens]
MNKNRTYYVDITLGHLKENEFYGFSIFNFVPNFLNVGFDLFLFHDPETEKDCESGHLRKNFGSDELNFGKLGFDEFWLKKEGEEMVCVCLDSYSGRG